jgi:hypothetical protein
MTPVRRGDLAEMSARLSQSFIIVRPFSSKKDGYLQLELGGFEIRADTLFAIIEADKAILFQKMPSSFTKKDLELRRVVFNLYPQPPRMPTNLLAKEPAFETEKG